MQRQVSAQEQTSVDIEAAKNRFLSVSSSIEENTAVKSPPPQSTTKATRFSVHSDIKRQNVLSSIPLKKLDDLLDVRSHSRKHKKLAYHDEEPSIITLNVSGDRFQTHLSTLKLYPNTLLGDDNKREHYWNPETQEYFFDRHRACFEAILYYYQSHGRLRRPDFVPIDTFLEEISFFQLDIEACAQVRDEENIKAVKQKLLPRILWRRYIWFYFEFPQHSLISRIINITSMIFTIISCLAIAVESLPQYNNYWNNICQQQAIISNSTAVPHCLVIFQSPFFIIQTICVAVFTIEFILRLISTPSYFRFLISFFTWVDVCSIVPYYVFIAIELTIQQGDKIVTTLIWIRVLRILRFLRVFKIYLVFKRLKSLRVLSATIKESMVDFIVVITSLGLIAFLFGAATYFAEHETNGDVFDSIPRATYWGVITLTTVGYGDMSPITAIGRILSSLCALTGVAATGMLASVLVDNYQRVYNRKMYVHEPDISSVDISHIEEDDNSAFALQSSSRRPTLAAISRRLSAFSGVIKDDRRLSAFPGIIKDDRRRSSSGQLQFVISFGKNNKDTSAADHMVTVMKQKLTEAVATTDMDVDLKLIDKNRKELWTMSSSDSRSPSIVNVSL